MLQQTQVATVRSYFKRFIKAFPTVQKLAAAKETQVLRLWEGLGYYRRARQLHLAAKQLVLEFDGAFPQDLAALTKLPGIGRYTAGAIASIAFDTKAPIVEANTARLFARLIALQIAPSSTAGQKALWDTAEVLLPRKGVGEFNQALMELGSLVCTPNHPSCEVCPVMQWCSAHQNGLVSTILVKKKRPDTIALQETAIVVMRRGRVLLRKCGEIERWAGLWDFPRFANATTVQSKLRNTASFQREIVKQCQTQTGITVCPKEKLRTIRHSVTKYKITLDCYRADYVRGKPKTSPDTPIQWVLRKDLTDYPLSSTGRKIANLI